MLPHVARACVRTVYIFASVPVIVLEATQTQHHRAATPKQRVALYAVLNQPKQQADGKYNLQRKNRRYFVRTHLISVGLINLHTHADTLQIFMQDAFSRVSASCVLRLASM